MRDMFSFNIIYTPGTVKYLYPFVSSLLKWSDCSFRLVSNRCRPDEIELLRRLCHQHSRLELMALPFDRVIQHGQALSYLQSLETSEYFCFLDSDILATDYFLPTFASYLDQYAGLFSCSSSWCKAEEQILPASFQRMAGRHNRTDQSVCLGSTYFCIYNNYLLTQIMQSTDINFNPYLWSEIPVQYQDELIKIGLDKAYYDTGKLLNLLLLQQGRLLAFRETTSLQHIGGLSLVSDQVMPQSIFGRISNLIRSQGRELKRTAAKLTANYFSRQTGMYFTDAEEKARRTLLGRKFVVSSYFTHLLRALSENQPLPKLLTIDDSEIEEKVELVTMAILNLHQETSSKKEC